MSDDCDITHNISGSLTHRDILGREHLCSSRDDIHLVSANQQTEHSTTVSCHDYITNLHKPNLN